MKKCNRILSLVLIAGLAGCGASRNITRTIANTKWIHGAADCTTHSNPAIQVVMVNNSTYILRQNKCVNYEAPFMFLFIGKKKALLMDSGATKDDQQFPLFTTVDSLLKIHGGNNSTYNLIVAHTHAHGDHVAADSQFVNKPGVTLVGKSVEAVQSYFKLDGWPQQTNGINLGDRQLQVIPIPGHHTTSIAVYDRNTRLLFTGDSFYPGRLYIQDWQAFVASTQRLVTFANIHRIAAIIGNHIEMTNQPGIDYPIGTTCQPNEAALPLPVTALKELNSALKKMGSSPVRQVHDQFIIYPK